MDNLTTNKIAENKVIMFLGWLTASVPELHDFETPRMLALWDEFKDLHVEPSDGAIYAAGSRPLPDEIMAEVQKRSLVQRVCMAYESGMGRGLSGRDLSQPYEPTCHEGIAYETGWYQGRSKQPDEPSAELAALRALEADVRENHPPGCSSWCGYRASLDALDALRNAETKAGSGS